jgi:hypothetical protein
MVPGRLNPKTFQNLVHLTLVPVSRYYPPDRGSYGYAKLQNPQESCNVNLVILFYYETENNPQTLNFQSRATLCGISAGIGQIAVNIAVLRNRDVYPGSKVKKIPDPGSETASKNSSIFNPKNCV